MRELRWEEKSEGGSEARVSRNWAGKGMEV